MATLTPRPQFSYPTNGWWAVKNSDGSIGVIKGNNPGANSVTAVYIGAANNLNDLATKLGTKLSNAIGSIGATPGQQTGLISQIDAGAGKNPNADHIFISTHTAPGTNNATSNVPTTLTGDAAAAGINVPDPVAGVLGSIWTALTNPSNWLRGLEILGAVVAIYLGLKSLTGAPGVLDVAEKVKP